jgi:thioredoxin 1
MKQLTDKDFDKVILSSSGVVVVDFFATWCGPCKSIAPILEQWDTQYEGVSFFKVDIDKSPGLAQRFKVASVPTFKFIKNGRVISTQTGGAPGAIEATIRSLLELNRPPLA